MTGEKRVRGLSIFARTFLLMLAALVVAEGIGLTLVLTRPPMPPADAPQGAYPPQRPSAAEPRAAPGILPPRSAPDARAHGPFPPDFYRKSALLFVIGLLALMPLAWFFAAALAAPIRRFAEAAQRLGSESSAAPLAVTGPTEIRAATAAFNAMQARIQGLLRERTQMVAAIAHDLRTPLARMSFRLNDLPLPARDRVDADLREMNTMITAALDFIRDRTLRAPREPLDFRLLVESVVDDASDQGGDVRMERGSPVTVLGDSLALKRAVANLVDNALKYGQRARLALHVDAQSCRLEIDDDGPGIPEALLDRVFEPFFRVDASRNRDTGGVGLGLATVRATAMDHGGDARATNRAGGGLRVTLWLPVANSCPGIRGTTTNDTHAV